MLVAGSVKGLESAHQVKGHERAPRGPEIGLVKVPVMGAVTGPVLEPDQRPSPQWPSECQVKGSATSLVNDPDISLVRWPTLGSDQIPVSSPIIDPVTGQSKAHYTTVQRGTDGLGQRAIQGPD